MKRYIFLLAICFLLSGAFAQSVSMQYLCFRVFPANAVLEVNDEIWSVDADGIATKFVEFGSYSYRVRAADYFPETGKVTVNDPDNTKIVAITLKPNRAEVTLKVEANAEIWVNNECKGVRKWTGPLGSGTYKIECKQASHQTTMLVKDITPEMNGQTIVLPAPIPIYGSLNIESKPQLATLYIDGKKAGETPKFINEILIGRHEIKLIKEGYADYTETVTITEGVRKQVLAMLKNKQATPEGIVSGKFSVSAKKQVYFSKGNLQYQASTNTWRFAENQWDMIGYANKNISPNYNGWIDLFGWGTSGYNHGAYCYQPYCSQSQNNYYYAYGSAENNLSDMNGKADWGKNAISNGGNVENVWRTLTQEEWAYVFETRKTSSGSRYVKANVNGINGVILLPDNWNNSVYRFNNTNDFVANYNNNVVSIKDWESIIEANGAVFLPAAGYRFGTNVYNVGPRGHYWSSSHADANAARYTFFDTTYAWGLSVSDNRFYGFSVRLVCPVD